MEYVDKNHFFDIPGFKGIYQINLNGQVFSIGRWVNANKGGKMFIGNEILSNWVDGNGYLRVKLTLDKKHRSYFIHRLLAITFIPNPENHPLVRHLDDNPLNLELSNLAWGTKKDNAQDSIKNGGFAFVGKGEKNHMYGRRGVLSPIYGKPYKGRIKKGADNPKSKIVFDTQTGIFYDSLSEASIAKNIPISRLSTILTWKTKINKTGLIYV